MIMKALGYKETPLGSKIIKSIKDAKLNKLETNRRAIEHTKTLPDYSKLMILFDEQKKLVEQYQASRRRSLDSPQMRLLLNDMADLQAKLEKVREDYAKANPVYLVPSMAVLAEDSLVETMLAEASEPDYISITGIENGLAVSYSVIKSHSVGKKYRMPGDINWRVIVNPDETLPDNAVFTDPDAAELAEANRKRVSKLTAEQKEAEKENRKKGLQQIYASDIIISDIDSGQHSTPEAAKKAAKKRYEKAISDLNELYA